MATGDSRYDLHHEPLRRDWVNVKFLGANTDKTSENFVELGDNVTLTINRANKKGLLAEPVVINLTKDSSAIESFCGIVAPPVVGALTAAGYGDSAGALIAAFANFLGLAGLVYMRAAGLYATTSTQVEKKLK